MKVAWRPRERHEVVDAGVCVGGLLVFLFLMSVTCEAPDGNADGEKDSWQPAALRGNTSKDVGEEFLGINSFAGPFDTAARWVPAGEITQQEVDASCRTEEGETVPNVTAYNRKHSKSADSSDQHRDEDAVQARRASHWCLGESRPAPLQTCVLLKVGREIPDIHVVGCGHAS